MKYLSITDFKMMELKNDSDLLDNLFKQRVNEFIEHLETALKGEVVHGLKEQTFTINHIARESRVKIEIDEDINGIPNNCYTCIIIILNNYDVNKMERLTADTAEKDMKKHIFNLLGKSATISWGRPSFQGSNYITLDLSIKPKLILKDYVDYCKYLDKVDKLEINQIVAENKVEDDIKKLFKPK